MLRLALPVVIGASAVPHAFGANHAPGEDEHDSRLSVEEVALGDIDSGIDPASIRTSDDKHHLAYVARFSGKRRDGDVLTVGPPGWFLVLDGEVGPVFEEVGNPVLRSDGRHAYSIKKDGRWHVVINGRHAYSIKKDGRWHVVINGVEGKGFDTIAKPGPEFSPDGTRVAYGVKDGDHWRVVCGDSVGPEFDGVAGLGFSEDGSRFAYAGRKGNQWFPVVDGEVGTGHESMKGLAFSPDGNVLTYVANDGGSYRLAGEVADDELEFDRIWEPVVVGAGEGSVAYRAARGEKWLVVRNGVPGPEYDAIGDPVWSPDGRRLAYPAFKGGTWRFVVDGEEGKASEDYGPGYHFSPGGEHFIYAAVHKDRNVIVVGEKEWAYDTVGEGEIRVDDQGRPSFWAIDDGKCRAVIAGKEGPTYDGISTEGLVFSSDGKRVGYSARRGGKWFAVVDGKEGKPFDGLAGLRFSPSGRHHAYLGIRSGKGHVVLDGLESGPYEGFIGGMELAFDSEERVHAIAGRDGKPLRLRVALR